MRIDREGFLLAVAALAGCERADMSPPRAQPVAPLVTTPPVQQPAMAMPEPVVSTPAPIEVKPEPPPAPVQPPAPRRVVRPQSVAKRWFLALSTEQRSGVSSFCGFRSENPCAGMLGQVGLSSPSEKQLKIEAEVVALPKDKLAKYCDESFPAPHCDTPLVVAFEGQPVEFEPARGAQFAFVPGDPAATDWPTATTPWLAIDRDGDGAITSGAELFGSSTMLAGGRLAHDGFAALAALDDNGDGSIDARDSMFQRLVLWSDRDGDHRSTPDELRALGSTVTSISLTFTRDARCNERDDCEGERGTLHWRDTAGIDHVGAIIDVYIPRRP